MKGKKKKTSYIQGNTLNIDVETQIFYKGMIALGIVGLSAFISYESSSEHAMLGFFLAIIVARIYMELDHAPGIYKNGKYLGAIYKGLIKAGDNLAIGRKQDTETIGSLKILKDGKEVVKLALTPEGFMELKPDKISEVFPEIKGKVERFGKLFKVGDYTLEYSFFKRTANASYQGTANASYQGTANTSHSYENGSASSDYISNPVWSCLPANIYYRDHH